MAARSNGAPGRTGVGGGGGGDEAPPASRAGPLWEPDSSHQPTTTLTGCVQRERGSETQTVTRLQGPLGAEGSCLANVGSPARRPEEPNQFKNNRRTSRLLQDYK